jgi:hypothetical protein
MWHLRVLRTSVVQSFLAANLHLVVTRLPCRISHAWGPHASTCHFALDCFGQAASQ